MDTRAQAHRSNVQIYNTSLDRTLKELQKKVQQHEKELEKLRSEPEQFPPTALGQAKVIQAALKQETDSEPFLPFPGSLLPALLAVRKTHQTIQESNAYLESQRVSREGLARQLEEDQVRLKDQVALKNALEKRIQSVRGELYGSVAQAPEAGQKEQLQKLKREQKFFEEESARLLKVLLTFMDGELAPMLAAEELGGPVVGDLMDIDSEDLAAGFNSQGKLKKAKESAGSDGKRQQRIDEIWGQGEQDDDERPQNEVAAAVTDVRDLMEQLLNQLTQAKGDNSESYVQLPRDSAAARFLVRSKVAQFHPQDATRLRLVDFGRELEE